MTRKCQWATVAPELGLGPASCFRNELAPGAHFCQEHIDRLRKEALAQARQKNPTTPVRHTFVTHLMTAVASSGASWLVEHWDEFVQILATIRTALTLDDEQRGELIIFIPGAGDEPPHKFAVRNPDTWRPGQEFLLEYPPDVNDDLRREVESCTDPFTALGKLIAGSVPH